MATPFSSAKSKPAALTLKSRGCEKSPGCGSEALWPLAAIQEFVTHKRALGLVYWRTEYHLRSLLGQVGDVELRGISVQQVEQFLKRQARAITRFWLSKYRAAGVFFRYAISRGYMESAPLPKSVPKMPAQFVPYLYSTDEMRRLLAIPDSCYPPRSILAPLTMRTLLLLLYGTGLRLGEGASLKWGDVDLEEGLLTVRETKFFKLRASRCPPTLSRFCAPTVTSNGQPVLLPILGSFARDDGRR